LPPWLVQGPSEVTRRRGKIEIAVAPAVSAAGLEL
jgi:hypothetical protein